MKPTAEDTTATTTVVVVTDQITAPKADNVLALKRPVRDIHEFGETAIYLDDVVLNDYSHFADFLEELNKLQQGYETAK